MTSGSYTSNKREKWRHVWWALFGRNGLRRVRTRLRAAWKIARLSSG